MENKKYTKENNVPQITVLMSTYNGEKYIEEQLESIFSQIGVNVKLLIRDDGSTDNTQFILDKWSKNVNLSWFQGDNIGAARSFMELVKISEKSEYYAFSDQDDVWDKDKLVCGICKIEKYNKEKPLLYYSNYRVVDKNLNIIREVSGIRKDTYATALLQSRAIGCSIIFNYKAKQVIEEIPIKNVNMHDAWMYRMCYTLGEVVYDDIPHFSYRQHESNVIGTNKLPFEKWFRRVKKIRKFLGGYKIAEIKSLYNLYGENIEDPYKERIIFKLSKCNNSLKDRFSLFLDKDITMVSYLDTFIFKTLLLLGIFNEC